MWAALTTRQRRFALGAGPVRRYPREIAPFVAFERADVDVPAELAALVEISAARGATPFLHVSDHNRRAIELYLRLGFVERARLGLWKVQRPS